MEKFQNCCIFKLSIKELQRLCIRKIYYFKRNKWNERSKIGSAYDKYVDMYVNKNIL